MSLVLVTVFHIVVLVSFPGVTPPPSVLYKDIGWPILSTIPKQLLSNPAQGTVTDMLALTQQQSTDPHLQPSFLVAGDKFDHTKSLLERTQDLRNWLRRAKTEHQLLSRGVQQAKH